MNKLTIAFIVITVVVVLIIGTLLGLKHFSVQEQVTRITTSEKPQESVQPETEPAKPEQIAKEPAVADYPAIISPFDTTVYPKVDITKVVNAGFKVADLVSEDFDGIIFKNIDITEYNNDNHKQFIITESDEYAGTIDELIFANSDIALEVYNSIKAKINDIGQFEINETNQYGDHSFFANNSQELNSVFLVVKINERLYTLYYPAKNHNKMKNLINLL